MKSIYRIFDWMDEGEESYKTLKEAKLAYHKKLKENPLVSWRLYKDTELKNGSFKEECLMDNRGE